MDTYGPGACGMGAPAGGNGPLHEILILRRAWNDSVLIHVAKIVLDYVTRIIYKSASSRSVLRETSRQADTAYRRSLRCHSGARRRREPGIHNPRPVVMDSGPGPSGRPGMTAERSVPLDALLADQLAPTRDLLPEIAGELLRRARRRGDARRPELASHVCITERRVEHGVEPGDHGGRGSGRRERARPLVGDGVGEALL